MWYEVEWGGFEPCFRSGLVHEGQTEVMSAILRQLDGKALSLNDLLDLEVLKSST